MDYKTINSVYTKYKRTINMSLAQIRDWNKNKNKNLSPKSVKAIKRNIVLLNKKKTSWTLNDCKSAITIYSNIKRIKKTKAKKQTHCGLSIKTISLLNHGFNPNKKKKK